MSKPRPTEVRAVAELLLAPAEDEQELALRVIQKLDELRAGRVLHTVLTVVPGSPTIAWATGSYSTTGQAEKARERGIGGAVTGSRTGVVPVYPEAQETLPSKHCPVCGHPRIAHSWPRTRIVGCVVTGCDCEETGK